MITKEQYAEAIAQRDRALAIIHEYSKQEIDSFDQRWNRFLKDGESFAPADLVYSAGARCRCGAGLAYPKNCGGFHHWSCGDVLTGHVRDSHEHDEFPFNMYEIKSEQQASAHGQTTRPQT